MPLKRPLSAPSYPWDSTAIRLQMPHLEHRAGTLSLTFLEERLGRGPPQPLATFQRKKPSSDDRATNLGARTRRQVAADKL
jgi:hypothetical protein